MFTQRLLTSAQSTSTDKCENSVLSPGQVTHSRSAGGYSLAAFLYRKLVPTVSQVMSLWNTQHTHRLPTHVWFTHTACPFWSQQKCRSSQRKCSSSGRPTGDTDDHRDGDYTVPPAELMISLCAVIQDYWAAVTPTAAVHAVWGNVQQRGTKSMCVRVKVCVWAAL